MSVSNLLDPSYCVGARDGPPTPQHPSPLRGTLGISLRSPGEVEGNEGKISKIYIFFLDNIFFKSFFMSDKILILLFLPFREIF